jgi:hypothetical protein
MAEVERGTLRNTSRVAELRSVEMRYSILRTEFIISFISKGFLVTICDKKTEAVTEAGKRERE